MLDGGQAELLPEPRPTVFRLRLRGDPMPMPRDRDRVVIPKDGSEPFVQHYTPAEARHRQNDIAIDYYNARGPHFDSPTPVGMRLVWAFRRPSTHLDAAGNVKERFLHLVPLGGGGRSGYGGDIDNLEKLVTDALAPREFKREGVTLAGAYDNDSQLCDVVKRKRYVDQLGVSEPGTYVEVWAVRP